MVSGYNLTMEPGTAKSVCFGLTANNVTVKLINKVDTSRPYVTLD